MGAGLNERPYPRFSLTTAQFGLNGGRMGRAVLFCSPSFGVEGGRLPALLWRSTHSPRASAHLHAVGLPEAE